MSTTRNDGGPAFPVVHDIPAEPGYARTIKVRPGMTLRDYFAAKAMPSLMDRSGGRWDSSNLEYYAQVAYEMADAMLRAREAA